MFKKIKTDIITDNESIDTLSKILEKVTLIETQLSKKEYDENMNCKEETTDIIYSQFKNCRSVYDICEKFPEFEINKSSLIIYCKICALAENQINIQMKINPYNTHLGVFSYEKEWENSEFENLPTKFRNLKKSLKRHLILPGHLSEIG